MKRAAAVVAVALLLTACGTSASARLAKDLIPARALQSAPWSLRVASNGRTQNPFGVPPSGAPAETAATRSDAVATRQWVHGSGALASGALPDGIFSVIDTASRFRSPTDAQALLADLARQYRTGSSEPVAGASGATAYTAPFASGVPGGQVTGRQELVVIPRGAYVFTVLVVGGGSRPTSSDAQTLATLQAAAIPASLPR